MCYKHYYDTSGTSCPVLIMVVKINIIFWLFVDFFFQVQSFSYGLDGEVLKVTNDDRPLQKLVERLDHAFLHG